jgi:hypothetical protein
MERHFARRDSWCYRPPLAVMLVIRLVSTWDGLMHSLTASM